MRIRDDEDTLAVCTRCGQYFAVRAKCPHCADLLVSVRVDEQLPPTWRLTIRRQDEVLADVRGFFTHEEARDQARRFLRILVLRTKAGDEHGTASTDQGSRRSNPSMTSSSIKLE